MGPVRVVVADLLRQVRMQGRVGPERMQVDAFVFQRPPQPLDEHDLNPAPATTHADLVTGIGKRLGER